MTHGRAYLMVLRSVNDILRTQSRFVKFYKPTLGLKYVYNRPYNEFITPGILYYSYTAAINIQSLV